MWRGKGKGPGSRRGDCGETRKPDPHAGRGRKIEIKSEEKKKKKERREESSGGRKRARTAVVNGNNCCGRCHSKARVPNARCQTVVRVITVITSYRDTPVCTGGRCASPMRNVVALASAQDNTQRGVPRAPLEIRNRFSTRPFRGADPWKV